MDGWITMARWMTAIFGVAVLLWVAWASRRRGAMSIAGPLNRLRVSLLARPGMLRCRESVRLTPQHTLHVIEYGPRRFILACHPAGALLLGGELDSLAHSEEIHAQARST